MELFQGAILNIVWTCNKYLTLCKIVSASAGSLDAEAPAFSTVSFPSTDLPDYATAMNDPRFAKSPLFPVPPPPYSAIVTEQEEQAAAQTQVCLVCIFQNSVNQSVSCKVEYVV